MPEIQKGFKEDFLAHTTHFTTDQKNLFERIYKYWETRGELVPPAEMVDWIQKTFGSVDDVKVQDFIKITNIILYEGAIFNELRTKRPTVFDIQMSEVLKQIAEDAGGSFAHPLTGTPEDVFGRIKGKYCVTASNVTKYDGLHGLVIYDNHYPLEITSERIKDYFSVSKQWFRKAHKTNAKAIYPFYTWNCLWKAGASIIHGHAQLCLTEGQAYAKIEEMRSLSLKYQETYKANYFDDDYKIHESLGLAFEKNKVRLHVKITPVKEKEIILTTDSFDDNLAEALNEVLNILKEKLAVYSFNVGIIIHPMEKTAEVWDHMPIVVRIVDRGSLSSKTADVGSMELFAQSVIGSNPYGVFKELKAGMLKT